MTNTTVPFHLELRTAGGEFLTDAPCETAEVAALSMAIIARRSGPKVYGPYGTHRLVIPARGARLHKPDEAAWQASADRRRAEAAAEAAQEAYANAEDVSPREALDRADAVYRRTIDPYSFEPGAKRAAARLLNKIRGGV